MKTKLTLLSTFAAMLLLCGCKGNQIDDIEMEYFPALLGGDNKWGMVSPDGDILFSNEFKEAPTPVYNGIFWVKEEEGYSLYYAKSKPELVPGCDKLVASGIFACDDFAPITRKGKRISVIDRNGDEQFVLGPAAKKEIVQSASMFTDGMLLVMNEEGKWGAYNREGELAVPCRYDYLSLFNDGIALAIQFNNKLGKKRQTIIDTNGNVLATVEREFSVGGANFVKGLFFVLIGDKRDPAFLTKDGKISTFPDRVKGVTAYNGDYYVYIGEGGGCGIMEGTEVLLAAKYRSLTPIDRDWKRFLAYTDDEEYRIVDRDGDVITKLDYKNVEIVTNNVMLAKEGKSYVLINEDGKEINSKLDIKEMESPSYFFITIPTDLASAKDAYNKYKYNHYCF